MAPRSNQLSLIEIDRMIASLERAMDTEAASGQGHTTVQEQQSEAKSKGKEETILRLQFDSGVWEQFIEYCRQNELDPDQMIREAVASYYLDLLKTYRGRIASNSEFS